MGYKDDNYSSRVCNHHPETCTCRDWDINEKPKQETIEETARKYASYNIDDHFEAGEWPIEIMYSEEEVKQIIEATLIEYSDYVLADIPEWFEQFKKK